MAFLFTSVKFKVKNAHSLISLSNSNIFSICFEIYHLIFTKQRFQNLQKKNKESVLIKQKIPDIDTVPKWSISLRGRIQAETRVTEAR